MRRCSAHRPEGTRLRLTPRFAPGYAISALPRSVVSGEAAVDVDVAEFGGGVPAHVAGLRPRPHAS